MSSNHPLPETGNNKIVNDFDRQLGMNSFTRIAASRQLAAMGQEAVYSMSPIGRQSVQQRNAISHGAFDV